MRQNLPVTQREYPFPEGATLVSTTDLQGRILYCNAPFIAVSGYTKDELLGQPHNLIRHPDMPEEAFRDMWATIASGRPWSALVKNRRKDGDHYWVRANVTPIIGADGRPSGYMSVRTLPSRADVQQAEQLYAQMREEARQGRRITGLSGGLLVSRSWWGRLRERTRLGLRGEMMLGSAVVGLVGFVIGEMEAGHLRELTWGDLGFGLITVVVCAMLGGSYLQRRSVGPIQQLIGFANRMAAGDLTQRIDSLRSDEVGQLTRALNQLSVNLATIVGDARQGVASIRDATQEIAAGNSDLSARTESQASSLEQTASSMEEMTSTLRQTNDTAAEAARQAESARAVTVSSNEVVTAVSTTMGEIAQSSARIRDIIQVVDSIAFQTNILALNAAVEAARAGEQGRGFAVVATEVRTLAQRTSTAAREIRSLIERANERVEQGVTHTETARAAMDQVMSVVSQVSTLIAEISQTNREQLTGTTQINEAVSHLDGITQQNAALCEEISAAAMSLSVQAREVDEMVSMFRLSHTAPATAPASAVALRKAARARQGPTAPGR